MTQTETKIKPEPGEMISQTTGRIYPVTGKGLDKMLRDNQKWRKEQKRPLLGETLQIPFVLS